MNPIADDKESAIMKVTKQIIDDPVAMKRIRKKIIKLGKPVLITFSFENPEKKVAIAFKTYRDSLAAGIKTFSECGDEIDTAEAASDLLSCAFTFATVWNTVAKQLDSE